MENELEKVKSENLSLNKQIVQLKETNEVFEQKFTQGEEKYEKLFKLAKSQVDMTGIAYKK